VQAWLTSLQTAKFVNDENTTTAPDNEQINIAKGIAYGWAHDDAKPCAVNPKGTTKTVPAGRPGAGTSHRIDGAIINDMRRGANTNGSPGTPNIHGWAWRASLFIFGTAAARCSASRGSLRAGR
jgi:hypothetical protein